MSTPNGGMVVVNQEQRKLLEQWIKAHGTPQQVVTRCQIVLLSSDGESDLRIAKGLKINRHTCRLWRERFAEVGPEGLWEIKPGRGRKPEKDLATRIIKATLQTRPKGQTHWSSRAMAREQKVHHSTVARIWKDHELKPHRR